MLVLVMDEIRRDVENEIRTAFRGVTLAQGISLRKAKLSDRSREAPRNAHSGSPAHEEITDDWSRVTLDELESESIAHLDAIGFRYYIPALMLSVLDHYKLSNLRVIGTLKGLYPKKDNSWEYHMHRYSLLNPAQKTAIASFLVSLPKLVQLDLEDQKVSQRALSNYWDEYLQKRNTKE